MKTRHQYKPAGPHGPHFCSELQQVGSAFDPLMYLERSNDYRTLSESAASHFLKVAAEAMAVRRVTSLGTTMSSIKEMQEDYC